MLRFLFVSVVLMACSMAALSAPQVIADIEMRKGGQAINDVDPAKKKSITGELPPGISENSGWQDNVDVRYEMVKEDGQRFLRVTAKSAQAQMHIPMPDVHQQDGYYRLKVIGRSVGRSSINFGMRMEGAPYTSHWSNDLELDERWNPTEWSFRIGST